MNIVIVVTRQPTTPTDFTVLEENVTVKYYDKG